jgi:hypothetical protein
MSPILTFTVSSVFVLASVINGGMSAAWLAGWYERHKNGDDQDDEIRMIIVVLSAVACVVFAFMGGYIAANCR